jgi:hypothetical protein
MVIMIVESWFPPGKSSDAGKTWIEIVKKYPPDRSISKRLFVAVRPTREGMNTIGVWDVKDGKYKEALARMNAAMLMYGKIEGFNYEIKTYMSAVEAMPIIGLEVPD